jgi:hypothetical protein
MDGNTKVIRKKQRGSEHELGVAATNYDESDII